MTTLARTARIVCACAAMAACAGAAQAADSIRTSKASISGTIEQMTAEVVTIRRSASRTEQVPVNEIQSIRFDAEPPKLNLVRSAAANGNYDKALETLDELAGERVDRAEVQQELTFYRAYCAAHLALGGRGSVREAGQQMREFVDKNPDSFHHYDATQLLGDLFLGVEAYSNALAQYAKVEAAPWPDFKLRAGVAKARVLQIQGKKEEALAAFDAVLAGSADAAGELVDVQRLAATLGKAACLADLERYDESVGLVEKVIASAQPEETELHALAYNTLGAAQKKAGNTRAALLAYLHVDLLYDAYPKQHAEALRNLVELWTAVGEPDRAAAALDLLEERYSAAGASP